jgi:hypothetical protein
MGNLDASYEKILNPLQMAEIKNNFPEKTEQNFILFRKTELACMKILSFPGKRALTPTNSIPPSDFPERNKENNILFLKIRQAKNGVFCIKTALVCRKITVIC